MLAPVSNNHKIYIIDYVNISGVEIRRLELAFYRGTLFKIDTKDMGDVDKAMEAKYWKGKLEVEEKEVSCRSGVGVTFTETEKKYTTTWETNTPNIVAVSYLSIYFDDKCKKKSVSNFYIRDTVVSEIIRLEENELLEDKEDEESKAKKEKLKDFWLCLSHFSQ